MFIAREKTLLLSKLTQLIKIIFCYQREQTKDVPLNEDHFLITSLCHIVKIVKKKKKNRFFFHRLYCAMHGTHLLALNSLNIYLFYVYISSGPNISKALRHLMNRRSQKSISFAFNEKKKKKNPYLAEQY